MTTATHGGLSAYWMPMTPNRNFKSNPKLIETAEGMYYYSSDGQKLMDSTAGLWCVNAGHGRIEIQEAVTEQMKKLDYASSFSLGHPLAFEFAQRLVTHAPGDLDHVFFTNSGSESVDTALKIALNYQRIKGEGSRIMLIGRQKAYHGMGFGGLTVGGLTPHRKSFGPLLPVRDHLPHTMPPEGKKYARGLQDENEFLDQAFEEMVAFHDPSNIAAVIVEPVAGAGGVIVPPKNYLKRMREICDQHGILLIFDEVVTGFGRLGSSFAAKRFDVIPDLMTTAKGITNGNIPMGAVFVRKHIYNTFMSIPEEGMELFHGYTYSGHPVACAAGMATLNIYENEGLFDRTAGLEDHWENSAHNLKDFPHVKDIRNLGLMAAVELESRPDQFGAIGAEVFVKCYEKGILMRSLGDTLAFSPPLIIEKEEIDQIFETVGEVLKEIN